MMGLVPLGRKSTPGEAIVLSGLPYSAGADADALRYSSANMAKLQDQRKDTVSWALELPV